MARNFSNVQRGRAPRRQTHWTEASGGVDITSTLVTLLTSLVPAHGGETVVRVRGLLSFVLTSAVTVGDGFIGALGIGVVTSSAAAVGVGSIPTPLTEAGWDGWLLHKYFAAHASVAAQGPGGVVSAELDSKAMRKMTADDRLVFVSEVIEKGAASASLLFRARVLSKEF